MSRVRVALLAIAVGALALGCASAGPRAASAGGAGAGARPAEAGAPEGGGGGETALRYTDARYGYSIDAPGPMRARADGTAETASGEERLSVSVVALPSGSDALAYARRDLATAASSPGYRLRLDARAFAVGGLPGAKLAYSWVNGTSQVTGKPNDLMTVRYYVPHGAQLAVIVYSIPLGQYDPQGADDVAGTFRWQ